MFGWALMIVGFSACSGADATDGSFTPSVSFLAPAEGSVVGAGSIDVTLIVEDFVLVEHTTAASSLPGLDWFVASAYAHNEEGTPAGDLSLTLDGALVVDHLTSTQTTLTVAAGAHTLQAALFYEDGDEVGATASVTFTAE